MNEIVNKFLFAGHKCMPEMRLRQPRSTYTAFGPFTKNKERIQKFKNLNRRFKIVYQNEVDKYCSQHVMACGDLPRRTDSDIGDYSV